jgi:glycosyltransferase involved in cell wall biosynthesis
MRIAVNVDFLADAHSDRAHYLEQLIESLGMIDGINEYLLLSQRALSTHPPTPSTFQWETVPVNAPSEQLRRVRWEQRDFPEAARRMNAKLLFVPHLAPPVMSTLPVVTYIPHIIPFVLTEYRGTGAIWAYHQLLARALKRCAIVMTPSEFTKSEIMRVFGVPQEQITVVPGAPRTRFRPVTDMLRLRAIRMAHKLGERFLLYDGGFDLRKQVPLMLGAFAAAMNRLHDTTTQFVLLGSTAELGTSALYPDWRPLIRKFGLEKRIVSINPPEEDIPAFYSQALAMIYPSLYEGFGWVPLEAMACGAPVIVADHPALTETIGNAGLTFTARDDQGKGAPIRTLATQITRIISEPELHNEYHLRSLARSKQFSWSQVAGETSAIFAEVTGTRY